jgi:hypothetical protein
MLFLFRPQVSHEFENKQEISVDFNSTELPRDDVTRYISRCLVLHQCGQFPEWINLLV